MRCSVAVFGMIHAGWLVVAAVGFGLMGEGVSARQPYDADAALRTGKERAVLDGRVIEEPAPPSTRASRESLDETDILHYELDIEVTDVDTVAHNCTVTGTNRMTIRSLSASLTEFTFRLRDTFTITGAFLNDTTAATVTTESASTRRVVLDRTYGLNEEFTLTLEYNGTPVSLGFGSFVVANQPGGGGPVVSSLSCPYYAHTWWPAKDGDVQEPGDNSDKATLDFSITVPSNYTVPATGTLQSVDSLSGDRAKYNWATDYPISTYLICFAMSEYNTWTLDYVHPGGTMPVEFYIYPAYDNTANRNAWGQVLDMLDVFTMLYGEYPFIDEKYGIYNLPFGGGMEHQTMTGQGGFGEILTAHELSHQWWGDMITCKTWSDVWLNEGFASYSEALWEEFKTGTPNPTAYFAQVQSRKPSSVSDSVYVYPGHLTVSRIFNSTYSYDKASWVLHQLRHVMGDAAFFDMFTQYRAAYEYSAVTTDEFVAVASAVHGDDLTWFFDQWVYQIGAPAYEYGWDTSSIAGQDYLFVQIKQVQSPSYPEVFTMPVDLVATVGGVPETFTVWNDQATQTFAIATSAPATSLQFDPDEWILRTAATETEYHVQAAAPAAPPHDAPKNRYISFDPNCAGNVAFQVELTAVTFFPGSTAVLGWVGEPSADDISRIVDEPYFSDAWPDVVHVGDCEIVPAAEYEIQTTIDGSIFLNPLTVATIAQPAPKYWADCVGDFGGSWEAPNGVVNMNDVMATLQLFSAAPTAPPLTWVDVDGESPNAVLNMTDVQRVVDGFKGAPYPFIDPADCP